MNNISEKICLNLIILKIFDIYFCHYFATNKKIAITNLCHAMEPQTLCHLIIKDKVAEQHISRKTLTSIILELQSLYSIVRIVCDSLSKTK